MGPLRRIQSNSPNKVYEAPFEAFKFPTSAIVQFRALIVPCIQGDCHPVLCTISSIYSSSSNVNGFATFSNGHKTNIYSYGRRKRRSYDGMKLTLRSLIGTDLNQSVTGNNNQTRDIEMDHVPLKEVEERVFIEVLEKRVKITQDGASNENDTSDSNESGQTTGSFETTSFSDSDFLPDAMEDGSEMSVDKLTTGQMQTTSSDFQAVTTRKPVKIVTKNRRDHQHQGNGGNKSRSIPEQKSHHSLVGSSSRSDRKSDEDFATEEDCFAIPIPYLIVCFLLLIVQLIFLIRYFLSTKTADVRSNSSYTSSSSFRPINSSMSSSSYARSIAFSMKLGDN